MEISRRMVESGVCEFAPQPQGDDPPAVGQRVAEKFQFARLGRDQGVRLPPGDSHGHIRQGRGHGQNRAGKSGPGVNDSRAGKMRLRPDGRRRRLDHADAEADSGPPPDARTGRNRVVISQPGRRERFKRNGEDRRIFVAGNFHDGNGGVAVFHPRQVRLAGKRGRGRGPVLAAEAEGRAG